MEYQNQEPEFDLDKIEVFDVNIIVEILNNYSLYDLSKLVEKSHPGDIEQAFDRLDDNKKEELLDAIPSNILSNWVDHMPASDLEQGLISLSKIEKRIVLESLSDDELVDFLQEIKEKDRSDYINLLSKKKREISKSLLSYSKDTAGGRMTMGMATIKEGMNVKEALKSLEKIKEEAELLSRIYVVDSQNKLVGKVRLRDLAFNERDTPINDLMDSDYNSLISVNVNEDQELAAQMIARYDLIALPVVNKDNQLLGVITHDDALEIIEEESTEDIEKLSGIASDSDNYSYLQTSTISHLKKRLPWVVVLAFLSLTSGIILNNYEKIFTKFYILSLYLPMIVAAGGNTGSQSSTMVIRAMSLGEISPKELLRVLWKESKVGILLGSILGIAVISQIYMFLPKKFTSGELTLLSISLVVGLSILFQVFTSTVIGSMLPIVAKKIKLDPAVVASPAITTIVDVIGVIIYFKLATMIFM